MRYYCQDCSYTGKQCEQGVCPACGSKRITSGLSISEAQKAKPSTFRLVAALLLWVVLIVEIVRKLQ